MDFVPPGSWTVGAITISRMKVVTFGVLLAVIGLTWLALANTWLRPRNARLCSES